MADTSGRLFEMPWAVWDHDSSSWRTYAGTSHSGSRKFSGTWPTSGSMRDGACYEHPTWGHPTDGSGSSLLPTPTSRDHKGRNQRDDTTCLPGAIHYLPTPTASDAVGSRNRTANRPPDSKHHDGVTLTDVFWTGVLTDPPSSGGKPCADPHQPPLPTEG